MIPNLESASTVDTLYIRSKKEQPISTSLRRIQDSLIDLGYLNSIVETRSDSINYNLYLNNKYQQITATIKYVDSTIGSSLSRKRTEILPVSELRNFMKQIEQEQTASGKPFSKTQLTQWDFDSDENAFVEITIFNQGKQRTIDRIVIEGYPNYPKNIINAIKGARKVYNQKNIQQIDNEISRLPYIQKIREPETLFKNDSTLLYFYIKKRTVNRADGLLTFNNDEEGDVQLNGYLNARLENNFNYGERLDLVYRNDGNDQTYLNVQLTAPALLWKRLGATGGLKIQRRDSVYQNNLFEIGANYLINQNLSSDLKYQSYNSTPTETPLIQQIHKDGLLAQIAYRERNSSTLQPEALSITIEGGFYKRTIDNTDTEQFSITAQVEKLWKLNRSFNLLVRSKTFYLDSEDIKFNELQQLGGNESIRGFNQNAIDTRGYSLLQTDLRYLLNDQIYLNLLNDTGIFEEFQTRNSQFMYAIGAGFGILTNAGILRFQVANGRFLSANESISNTIAHINLEILF